jgi:hypothetical protein
MQLFHTQWDPSHSGQLRNPFLPRYLARGFETYLKIVIFIRCESRLSLRGVLWFSQIALRHSAGSICRRIRQVAQLTIEETTL